MNPNLDPGWKRWAETGLGLFYPEVCQCCRQESAWPEDGYVGAACRERVKRIRRPYCDRCGLPFDGEITTSFECANCREMTLHFLSARSAVAAEGVTLDIIHQYKYHRALWFEPFLAGLLIQASEPELRGGPWDLIVPVPLHPRKEREREFNQAARLARRLSRAIEVPLHERALRRVQATRTQTRLSRTQRAANVRGAFIAGDPAGLDGACVILVDDVLTTGATTSACAAVLRDHGAAQVCVWTVARGLLS
jgi:ComF family protein